LIVTCEECTTSFQLDEARIPPGGARVRCSRCKHAFFLPNPNESQPEAVHSIAEDAAADPSVGTPQPASDLNGDTWDGLGGAPVDIGEGASQTAATEPVPESTPEPTPEPAPEPELDDEEDWQFSEEVRVEGDDLDDDLEAGLGDDLGEDFGADAAETMGGGASGAELDFGAGQDFSEGFDESTLSAELGDPSVDLPPTDEPEIATLAAEEAATSSGIESDAPAAAATSDAPVRDESSFGSVDDFSSLMEDEDSAPSDAAASLASEIASELAAEEAEAGLYASGGQSDDLGDPESWDLVGHDEYAVPANATAPTADVLALPVDAGEFFNDDAFEDAPAEIDLASTPLMTGPVGQALRAAGWAVAAAASVAVIVLAGQAEWARFSPSPQSVAVGPIAAQTTTAGWVETARAGAVLRFEGEVQNTAGQAVYPSAVQITLLDAQGARLPAAPLRAGFPLATETLREAAPEILAERAAAAARRFARTPLAPGEAIGFEALLPAGDLPEGAARALLEVGEARPAPAPVAAPIHASTPEPASGPTGFGATIEADAEPETQAERSSP